MTTESDLQEALSLLRAVEWVHHTTGDESWSKCPCCGAEGPDYPNTFSGARHGSHYPDCRLAAFLSKHKEPGP